MRAPCRSIIAFAALILLADGIGAGEADLNPSLESPTESKNAAAQLRSKKMTWTVGETVQIEYRYHRMPGRSFASLGGDDPKRLDVAAIDAYMSDMARSDTLYNPWLCGNVFPKSGFIAVFDEKGRFRGPVFSNRCATPRNADDRDWFPINSNSLLAIDIDVPTSAADEGETRTALPVGKWRLQACLNFRYFEVNEFDAARRDVLRKRNPKLGNSRLLSPEQRGQVPPDDAEFIKSFEPRWKRFTYPSFDEIVFRSNILEIEIVPAEAKRDEAKKR